MSTSAKDFSTCALCDAHKGDSDGAFRVLPPLFRDFVGAAIAFRNAAPAETPQTGTTAAA